jgi:hypothetical protein
MTGSPDPHLLPAQPAGQGGRQHAQALIMSSCHRPLLSPSVHVCHQVVQWICSTGQITHTHLYIPRWGQGGLGHIASSPCCLSPRPPFCCPLDRPNLSLLHSARQQTKME